MIALHAINAQREVSAKRLRGRERAGWPPFEHRFHGTNSWSREHFLSRLRNSAPDLIAYIWHRHLRGDLFAHPRFRLSDIQKLTFASYLDESQRLGLL